MIDPELLAKIRLLFFAEHWKIGTIATQLNLHRDTVRAALETDRFNRPKQDRSSRKTDRKSTRLNSSHVLTSRMPSSA